MSLVVSYSKMFHLGIPEREKNHDSNYQQRPLTDPQRFRPVQSCCLVQCVKDYQSSIYIYIIYQRYIIIVVHFMFMYNLGTLRIL